MKTRIIALGSTLRGDDGIASAVINALGEMPPHVEVIDAGTPGLSLVLLFENCARVIIVDAAEMGLPPGAWRALSIHEVTESIQEAAQHGTLHAAGLPEALLLAEALGVLPDELIIYGVQPASVGWEASISPELAETIPAVAAALRQAVGVGPQES